MMERWDEQEKTGLSIRLKAIRLFPHFFSQLPSGRRPRDVDVYKMVACLRPTAYFIEQKQIDPLVAAYGCRAIDVWDDEDPADLLFQCLNTLRKSLSSDPEPSRRANGSPKLMSSWSGVLAAIAFFHNSVCGVSNEGRPIDAQLHRRVLAILKRDVQKSELVMRAKPGLERSLWFWKVFIAALTLALRDEEPAVDFPTSDGSSQSRGDAPLGYETTLDAMRGYYEGCVRAWIGVAGVSRWQQAEETLEQIAWPKLFPNKPVAQALWRKLSRPQGSSSLY